ncbi:hypothetical protein ACL02T_08010 [Pseudonocardia sp. RS010]|uniref:hypothetical protein n=1 Tax=Pseudonocardia sp. RS010 TaxID=3385979 RepID=UPI0039A1C9D6
MDSTYCRVGHLFRYLPNQPGHHQRLKAAAPLLAQAITHLARVSPSWCDDPCLVCSGEAAEPAGRPGTEAASASRAPCVATQQTCTTMERSTPQLAAASRWVACWVSTCTNHSYFSDGASRLRPLRAYGSDMISNLPRADQASP